MPKFDPLFKDIFFKEAEKPQEDEITLSFPLPDSVDDFEEFLNSEKGEVYRNGVKNLVTDLEAWANAQEVNYKADNLGAFLKHFEYTGSNKEVNPNFFPLFTEGVINLAKIIHQINTNTRSLDFRKETIQELISGIGVCAPGTHTNIFNAYLKLSGDLPTELMAARRALAENAVLEFIKKHPELHIHWGMEIHWVNGILNAMNDLLGIPIILDEFSQYPTIENFSDEFLAEMVKVMTASQIIRSIVDNSLTWEKIRALNPDLSGLNVQNLEQWLQHYGKDSFPITKLFYDAENDEYRWIQGSEYYLYNTLFNRLADQGYINLEAMQTMQLPDKPYTTFFIPREGNIALAYVKEKDDTIPFIVYYLDQSIAEKDISSLEKFCTPEQIEALHEATFNLLRNTLLVTIPDPSANPESKKALLQVFNTRFPNHYLILMELLSKLDTAIRLPLVKEFKLQERVLATETLDPVILYLSLFPKELWGELLTTQHLFDKLLPPQELPAVLEVINLLLSLDQPSLDSKNLKLLIQEAGNASEIKKCMDWLARNQSTGENSLINNSNVTLLIKHAKFAKNIVSALDILKKINNSMISNENIKLLTENGEEASKIAGLLEELFQIKPELANNENCQLLINKFGYGKSIIDVLTILEKANPKLINDENFKLLVNNAHSASDASVHLNKLSQSFPALINLEVFQMVLDPHIRRKAGILRTLEAIYQANPERIEYHKIRLADKVHYQELRLFDIYDRALFTDENCALLTNHPNEAWPIVDAMIAIYKINPDLINDENRKLINQAAYPANVAYVLQRLYEVNPDLVNAEIRKLLAENPGYTRKLASGLNTLHSHQLANNENIKLILNYIQFASDIADGLTNLYAINPEFVHDKNKIKLLTDHAGYGSCITSILKLFNDLKPELITEENINLLSEHAQYTPYILTVFMIFNIHNQKLVTIKNCKLLLQQPENVEDISKTFHTLLCANKDHINKNTFNDLITLQKVNSPLSLKQKFGLYTDLFLFINGQPDKVNPQTGKFFSEKSVDKNSVDAARKVINFLRGEKVVFEDSSLDALNEEGTLNQIIKKYDMDIRSLPVEKPRGPF